MQGGTHTNIRFGRFGPEAHAHERVVRSEFEASLYSRSRRPRPPPAVSVNWGVRFVLFVGVLPKHLPFWGLYKIGGWSFLWVFYQAANHSWGRQRLLFGVLHRSFGKDPAMPCTIPSVPHAIYTILGPLIVQNSHLSTSRTKISGLTSPLGAQ